MIRAILLISLQCSPLFAQAEGDSPTLTDGSLVVAVREVPPFAMKDTAGNWEGLSVDLWQDVADKRNFTFSWKELSLQGTLAALAANEIDVAVPALTINSERERQIDFSHPYYVGGLTLGYPSDSKSPWLATLEGFVSLQFLTTVASLSLVLLIAGFAVWVFERRGNNQEFQKGGRGLGDGFWWSAVTMTTVGYGDKSPKTLGGRVVALIWMFASLIIIASFTASIAASLTAHRLDSDPLGDREFSDLKVAVLEGSNADRYATQQGARVQRYATLDSALEAAKERTAEAVVHDAAILRYRSRLDADWMEVTGRTLVRDDYGFGLSTNSPLREEINTALLTILLEPAWKNLRRRYLGEEDGWQ